MWFPTVSWLDLASRILAVSPPLGEARYKKKLRNNILSKHHKTITSAVKALLSRTQPYFLSSVFIVSVSPSFSMMPRGAEKYNKQTNKKTRCGLSMFWFRPTRLRTMPPENRQARTQVLHSSYTLAFPFDLMQEQHPIASGAENEHGVPRGTHAHKNARGVGVLNCPKSGAKRASS